LRTYLKETPVFKAIQARKEISKEMPVKQVLKTHKTAVAIGMLFTWFLTGCVVVVILAMPNLLTGTFGFERAQTFEMQSAAIVMQMVGCILAGYFADRFGCGKVMMVGALAVALTAAVFYNSLGHAAHSTIFGLYMLLGLCSGTVGMVSSSMVKMFPAPVRFSGISFSYNLSYAIVGGMTLPLVHWLSQYS
ncbi:MHS family MFS transporter, partial [Acinetobacter pittii]